jgi:molybdenum cofactor cytidylyltransferase
MQCPVAVPRYQGVRGHPVRFAAECGPELMKLTGNSGAAQVMSAYSAMNLAANIEIDDPGIVTDIDTLADLQRARKMLAAR